MKFLAIALVVIKAKIDTYHLHNAFAMTYLIQLGPQYAANAWLISTIINLIKIVQHAIAEATKIVLLAGQDFIKFDQPAPVLSVIILGNDFFLS